MTTDQLEDTDQVEETGAQVNEGDEAGDSGGTDGHTETTLAEDTSEAGLEEDSDAHEEQEGPTDSVVQSDQAADTETTPDVDEMDGELAEVDDEEMADDERSTNRFDVEALGHVPHPDAEGDEVDLQNHGGPWLEGLFERMELNVDVDDIDESDDRILVSLSGEDAHQLLGRGKMGPKALEAVETILSRVFAGHPRSNDIYLDVEGARQARTERLQNVAEDLADRAVELSKNVTLSGLNSSERRVIHHRLREDDRVETESVGDGIFRRLRIEPH